MIKNIKKLAGLILITFGLLACNCFAEDRATSDRRISFEQFKRLPILAEGRVKPLETYARSILLQFSGRETFQGEPAIEWLAKLVFSASETENDKVFLINHPEVPLAADIIPDPKRRYSFAQLKRGYHKLSSLAAQAAQIEEKKRTVVENEFLRVNENLRVYLELSQSFLFALPHEDFSLANEALREKLQLPEGQTEFSFVDIALKAEQIEKMTASLQERDSKTWNADEKEIFRLLTNLYQWSMYFHDLSLDIIPPLDLKEEVWKSPWDAIAEDFHNTAVRSEIVFLQQLAKAYHDGRQNEFDEASKAFANSVKSRVKNKRAVSVIPLELFYNRLKPFSIAQNFYTLAFFSILASFFIYGNFLYRLSAVVAGLGFLMHISGVATRITIMARPPVSSLYETFVFVSLIAAVVGFTVEFFNKDRIGLLALSICGSILLFIASKFSVEGDTMKMLVAVLNSNFWLTIHVLHITSGYAVCCLAGVLAHIYLITALVRPRDKDLLSKIYRYIVIVLGFGLTLTVFGTAMGGVWADQSWGRFWGWDPKENGALLIILWCAIIFHARVANLVGTLGVVVGSALVIPVVMWAWFGVNLLSVGLHSYGFTSGIAVNIIVYYVCEIIFLVTVGTFIRFKIPNLPSR